MNSHDSNARSIGFENLEIRKAFVLTEIVSHEPKERYNILTPTLRLIREGDKIIEMFEVGMIFKLREYLISIATLVPEISDCIPYCARLYFCRYLAI